MEKIKDVPEVVPHSNLVEGVKVVIHHDFIENKQAQFAAGLIHHFAIVAAMPDGEDSAGRQKMRLATPQECAERGCEIASRTFAEFEKRGWLTEVGSYADCEKKAKEKNSADEAKREFAAMERSDRFEKLRAEKRIFAAAHNGEEIRADV